MIHTQGVVGRRGRARCAVVHPEFGCGREAALCCLRRMHHATLRFHVKNPSLNKNNNQSYGTPLRTGHNLEGLGQSFFGDLERIASPVGFAEQLETDRAVIPLFAQQVEHFR